MIGKGSRKRAKASPSGGDSPSSPASPTSPNSNAPDNSSAQVQNRTSWYPGSWPAISRAYKAAPITEVARESISAAQNVASSLLEPPSSSSLHSARPSRHSSFQLTQKSGTSTRSLPAGATTTKVNIASDGSASTTALDTLEPPQKLAADPPHEESGANSGPSQTVVEDEARDSQSSQTGGETLQVTQEQATQLSGWLSWIYGSSYVEKDNTATIDVATKTDIQPADETTKQASPPITACDDKGDSAPQNPDQSGTSEGERTAAETGGKAQKRSWLQMWYGTASSSQQEPEIAESNPQSDSHTTTPEFFDSNMAPKSPTDQAEDAKPQIKTTASSAKPSGWSFWSRDISQDTTTAKKVPEAEVVEATMTPSNSNEPTSISKEDLLVSTSKKGTLKIKPSHEKRPKVESLGPTESQTTDVVAADSRPAEGAASKQLQKVLPNQVLPQFEDTYAIEESPSLLQSLGRLLHYTQSQQHVHVARVKEPPRINRALAIGVHGYFPAPLIRSVLGQPTGTSIRFSNMAADAIRRYTSNRGYSCEIEKIALEGEGRIAERVELLWKLLLNWMEEIRKADFILVACHSQGVPVSLMLVAKLISFGCVNASRVGVCAMAGVNLGPFSFYRSRWISGSAGELFEFELPSSKVSRDYEIALKRVLDFGVRISYVGSIDDQLVSLESSLFSTVTHPYIYRSVFVDGRVHAPSFLSHLVGFALKLRNLGISDHGLIRELSSPLAGSLYTGEGHSRLYDEEAVYYMAIQFALETTSVPSAQLSVKRSSPAVSPNPYILPFAMRGLLEEDYVRRELQEETMELLRQFDEWKPSTKVLKDVKFRLEGIRSKL
ncbi:Uncharacterized protein PECH_003422 [Penicillium ucsense]|uniref:YMC020W-like alpha/beta hydrolase domain-containing protein n=1 Tax=Penicillium ucsense TaxID=2839758 RepID=A0A8J8W8W5_9EURO|nr:Uncharacterized protein PECM_000232 [Penicillium ucsense]KAF7739443.1 Uncharacterized protein PECH_003422 [Penicillium ucsense]